MHNCCSRYQEENCPGYQEESHRPYLDVNESWIFCRRPCWVLGLWGDFWNSCNELYSVSLELSHSEPEGSASSAVVVELQSSSLSSTSSRSLPHRKWLFMIIHLSSPWLDQGGGHAMIEILLKIVHASLSRESYPNRCGRNYSPPLTLMRSILVFEFCQTRLDSTKRKKAHSKTLK